MKTYTLRLWFPVTKGLVEELYCCPLLPSRGASVFQLLQPNCSRSHTAHQQQPASGEIRINRKFSAKLFGKIRSDISRFRPSRKNTPPRSWKKWDQQGTTIWSRNFLSQLYHRGESNRTTASLPLANSVLVHMSSSQEGKKIKKPGSGPKRRKSSFYKNSSEKHCQLPAVLKHKAWHSQLSEFHQYIVTFQSCI